MSEDVEAATEENYVRFAADVMNLSEDEIIAAIVRLDDNTITRIKERTIAIVQARRAMLEIELSIETKKRELEARKQEYEALTQMGNKMVPSTPIGTAPKNGAINVGVGLGTTITAAASPFAQIPLKEVMEMYKQWEKEQRAAGYFLPARDMNR